jgi:DNA-binding MarR family transcriptional regulator
MSATKPDLAPHDPADAGLRPAALDQEHPGGPALPSAIDPELLAELPTFEQFFKTFGFKRVQGRVWGLLVLSERPLSSREICDELAISQGAASTTLTELSEWGAIKSSFDGARRCHVHAPVGNALSIAATILRRREQVAFQTFRQTAGRALEFVARKHGERDPRVLTLRSIISACDIADALMKLLVGAVANALGDGQSILSRAIGAALKVGLGEPGRLLTQTGPSAADAAFAGAGLAASGSEARTPTADDGDDTDEGDDDDQDAPSPRTRGAEPTKEPRPRR